MTKISDRLKRGKTHFVHGFNRFSLLLSGCTVQNIIVAGACSTEDSSVHGKQESEGKRGTVGAGEMA